MPIDEDSFQTTTDSSSSFFSANSSFCDDNIGFLLKERFKNSKFLNICHINAQSIPAHYTDLIDTFSEPDVHALLVSESWLKPTLSSITYALPGFTLIRNDRTGKGGGGVAIYLRSFISYRVISSSPSDYHGTAEHLFIEANFKGIKMVIGVVYCPPLVDYFSDLDAALDLISCSYKYIIIMGDLNTNLMKDSLQTRKLKTILNSMNLFILPLQPTHHNIDTEDSWLDIVCTSSTDYVVEHDQLSAPAFSRHDLLLLCYKIKPLKLKPTIASVRNFSRIDITSLLRVAARIDWKPILETSIINNKISLFNAQILGLFNKHAPLRTLKLRRPPAPWITEDIRKAMAKRNRAFQVFKKERSVVNFQIFKRARNRCNQVVRAAKRRHIHKNVLNTSSANIWKFLNSLGFGKATATFNVKVPLDDLNIHFSSAKPLDTSIKMSTIQEINSMPLSTTNSFTFTPETDESIRKTIMSIRSNATGHDEHCSLVLISLRRYWSGSLHIFADANKQFVLGKISLAGVI
ncbi:uncharacterized protein LOC131842825 [Achroia grisella]|uniref:uncharacterized protein LOC131842825 n=1 Tax=Achroia grisella TaxID=688607 RepID=UPI0027D22183|nr:uncharacterized protein LOC131842825 [Achroia grisella]